MSDLLARRLPARGAFEEVWFIEGSLDAERAFWLRYSLARTGSGPLEATVWAVAVEGDLVQAARESIATDPAGDALVRTPFGTLTGQRATGRIGALQWDLGLDARSGHDHVPETLARLGLTGRHYASPGLDLRVTGSLAIGDISLSLHDAPAVLGHIWGARATTRAWAWSHCSAFELHPDARFEALSAQLTLGPVTLPWATSAVVEVYGKRFAFTRTRTLFRARSKVGERDWYLDAESDGARLRAAVKLGAPEHVARIGLTHVNGRRTRVRNSPLSTLRVQLVHPDVGDVHLRSHRACLELAKAEDASEGEFAPHLGF